MEKKDWIAYCLLMKDSVEDHPFDGDWTMFRHRINRRGFAFLYERNGKLWMNLKCPPMEVDFLREHVSGFFPAYHMNKTHWITAALDGSADEQEVKQRIQESFKLTQK